MIQAGLAAALLHELVGPAQKEADIKLEFFERAKGDDGSAHIQKMIDILRRANGSVGALPKVIAEHGSIVPPASHTMQLLLE